MRTKKAPAQSAAHVPGSGTVHPAEKRQPSLTMAAICDELADLLATGGSRERTEAIVRIAAENKAFRLFDRLLDNPAELNAYVSKHGLRESAEWMGELQSEWRAARGTEPAELPEPATVAERIRQVVINTLEHQFQVFLSQSTAEERMLLSEVFSYHDSANSTDQSDLALAYAFQSNVAGRSDRYLWCPPKLADQVQQYIKCLKAVEPCKKAVA